MSRFYLEHGQERMQSLLISLDQGFEYESDAYRLLNVLEALGFVDHDKLIVVERMEVANALRGNLAD